jgi:hypothetical protein
MLSSFDGSDFEAVIMRAAQPEADASTTKQQQAGAASEGTLFSVASAVRATALTTQPPRNLATKKRRAPLGSRGSGDAWMLEVPHLVADPAAALAAAERRLASTNNIVTSSSALRSRIVATAAAAAPAAAVAVCSSKQESGTAPEAVAPARLVAVGSSEGSAGQPSAESAAASRALAAWSGSNTRALRRALSLLNHCSNGR